MADSQTSTGFVLIVDDERAALASARRALRAHGFRNVLTCADAREVPQLLEAQPVSLLLLDLLMPHVGGEELLSQLTGGHPDLPVIVVTAEHDVRTAVRCMKLGAADYLVKPVSPDQLVASVEKTLEQAALRYEATRLREAFFAEKVENPEVFNEIVTSDPAMFRIFTYIEAVSRASHPVLIRGETGTGKELVARALHELGRPEAPFVGVNVAGLDDATFADTLFGHERGAFTGAAGARRGLAESAGEGTLFLDEIGDLTESSQVKLLRLLQEREYYPLGGDRPRELRARVVAATHKDPTTLRPDLYYRLRSYCVEMPPLRKRLGDLPALVEHFLEAAASDLDRPVPTVPPELYLYLSNYSYPGNVRQLQSIVFDAVARHPGGVMAISSFLDQMDSEEATASPDVASELRFPFPLPTLRAIERAAVAEALRRVGGNQSAAARMLGVSRPTIGRHVRELRGSSRGDSVPGGRIVRPRGLPIP